MKATETKSAHSQQHGNADKSSADQVQERAFFSDRAAEQPAFFRPSAGVGIQAKFATDRTPFFQPARTPTLQRKCAVCEREQGKQAEDYAPQMPTVQRMPAFESEVEPNVQSKPLIQRQADTETEVDEENAAETDLQTKLVGNAVDPPADGEETHQSALPFTQAKLAVGKPNDHFEQEADAVADRVVATPQHRVNSTPGLQTEPLSKSITKLVQRQVASVPTEQPKVQKQENGSLTASNDVASRLGSNRGGGSELDESTRSDMESSFGADFSNVRVHTGGEATQLSQDLGAKAFTHGSDIYFNEGRYNPNSSEGKHLLAHELTHTIQQGKAVQQKVETPPSPQPGKTPPTIQKAPAAAGTEPAISSEVVDVSSNLFKPSDKIKAEIEAQGKKGLDVRVAIKDVTSEGRIKIKLDGRGNYQSKGSGWMPLLNPWTQQLGGMYINFRVKNNNIIDGSASLSKGKGRTKDWLIALQKNSAHLGGLGLRVSRLPKPVNKLENGKLTLGVTNLNVVVGGYVDAKFNLLLENTNKPKIDATADIDVKGITKGTLVLNNSKDKLAGEVSLAITFKSFNGEAKVKYNPDGTVDIGGKAAYNANKLSGEINFVATDLVSANKFAKDAIKAAGGKENVQKAPPPGPVPPPKSGKKKRALAATGQLGFNLTTWFAGTVNVVVDGKGNVTVIGKIAPPAEIILFKQKDWDKELIKFEAKAYYGIPLVGNLNLFANISLRALAKLGPAKLYNIEILGTYSTDPNIQKNIQISGSLNISAYAGLRLRAEGGAGITLVGHDLKFGVGLNADLGVKAYADARPTIGYRDPGVFFISGTLEMVAQPMLGLGGDFFIELDSPWWSPAPDKKWIWPLFSKEWPLGDPIGLSATLKDYELGSGKVPEIELKQPKFDPSKFMTSMVDNKLPNKSGGKGQGKGTFKNDGSVPKPTIPPKKAGPKPKDAKLGKKGTPPQGGKSAKPDPMAAKAQQSMKAIADAAKLLPALKTKAPFTKDELNKELAKVKNRARGVSFGVQPKGEKWIVTPKAGGKTGRKLELSAKDAKSPEKAAEIAKGIADIPKKEKPFLTNGKITLEEANKVAAQIKKAHPVFKKIRVQDNGNTLEYFYQASGEQSTKKKTPEEEISDFNALEAKEKFAKFREEAPGYKIQSLDKPKFKHPDTGGMYEKSSAHAFEISNYIEFMEKKGVRKISSKEKGSFSANLTSYYRRSAERDKLSKANNPKGNRWVFVEGTQAVPYSKVVKEIGAVGTDPALIKAINKDGLLELMKELALGKTVEGIDIAKLKDIAGKGSKESNAAKNREYIADRLRGLKAGEHEWIPASFVTEVIDRTRKQIEGGLIAKETLEDAGEIKSWIGLQHNMRSDTQWIIYKPSVKVTYEEVPSPSDPSAKIKYSIMHGHVGALSYTPFTGKKKRKPATVGSHESGGFHPTLESKFEKAKSPKQALEGALKVFKDWVWDGTENIPDNIHPTEETAKGINLKDSGGDAKAQQAKEYTPMQKHLKNMLEKYGKS